MDNPDIELDPVYPEDVDNDEDYDNEEDEDAETSFGGTSLQRLELKKQKIGDLYEHLGVNDGDANYASLDRFRLRTTRIGLELNFLDTKGEWVSLNDKRTGRWLADSTLLKRLGGEKALVHNLGLDNTPSRIEQAKKAVKALNDALPTQREVDAVPLENLPKLTLDLERELRRNSEDIFPMRELLGLDRALQSVRGEMKNNLAKLSDVDHKIATREREHENLDPSQFDDPEQLELVRGKLERDIRDLKEERKVRLEVLSENRKELRSQFSRIKETINKVLSEDASLAEKIRTIFREQGVTIAAVLSAFALLISTLVGFLTGGSGAAGAIIPPKNPTTSWLRRQLKNLARLFGKLAQKFGAALPGILGSIVSWLFTLLKRTAGFLAQNLWLLLIFVAGSLFTYARDAKYMKR